MGKGPIDIHTHIVPATFPDYAGGNRSPRWPQMQMEPSCRHGTVMIAGKAFRTVSDECWDVDRRVEAMARAGVACQVLSPMPELLSYWLEPADALALGRHVNDTIAEMAARSPQRFIALGMVPLQEPELAASELARLMHSGAFRGVEIGTNINGTAIGDPRFDAFFAAAEELGAAVFVHALHPTGVERLVGPPVLAALVAFPCETSFAITSLITGGTLARHPKLRLAFSHGGGAFAMVLPRLMQGWRSLPALAHLLERSPLELARGLYYDTLVYDAPTLRFLIDRFGATQLCLGTDHPFDIQEKAPLAPVARLELAAEERDLLLFANAERFLGIAPAVERAP
jgi:aminocarboxymuconate-semialdehyde decarboxylase